LELFFWINCGLKL
jgi:hypothetical protein